MNTFFLPLYLSYIRYFTWSERIVSWMVLCKLSLLVHEIILMVLVSADMTIVWHLISLIVAIVSTVVLLWTEVSLSCLLLAFVITGIGLERSVFGWVVVGSWSKCWRQWIIFLRSSWWLIVKTTTARVTWRSSCGLWTRILRSLYWCTIQTSYIGSLGALASLCNVKLNQLSISQTSHSMVGVFINNGRIVCIDVLSIVVSVDEAKSCFYIKPFYFTNYLGFWIIFVRRIFFNWNLINQFEISRIIFEGI